MTGLALVGALAVSGCADDEPDVTPTQTPSSSATTQDADPQTIADITAVHAEYWDAVVESQNGPNPDPALFNGIAEMSVVEGLMRTAQGLLDQGIHRTGEPTIGEPHITVDGTAGRLEVCVDEAPWGAVNGDTELPADTRGSTPRVFDLARHDDQWVLTRNVPQEEATIEC